MAHLDKAERSERVKAIHRRYRAAGQCINGDGRKVHKGGRCVRCWEKKLAAEREAYAARRESET
jgi:hypothetical protein